jgi:hypothetical protein
MLAPVALAPQDSPFAEVRRPVPVIESSSNGIRAVDLGDLDGDGAIDAVVATFTETVVLLNEGVGTFVATPATLPGGFVRLADVDGDLDADVILWGNPGSIQINDGSGNFSPSPGTLPGPLTNLSDVGDVDGDSDVDLWFRSLGSTVLWLNDGSGNFADASSQVPATTELETVSLGDVDGDGDLDALLVRAGGSSSVPFDCTAPPFATLFLNDGNGVFSDASRQLAVGTESIVVGSLRDADGDGDLDALVTLETCVVPGSGDGPTRTSRVFLNDGNGTFTERVGALPPDVLFDRPHDVGDADGDGDPDLLTLAGIFVNDGSGVFSDTGLAYPTDTGWRRDYYTRGYEYGVPPVVADLDLDVDLFGHRGGQHFGGDDLGFGPAMNLIRHVSWHSLPRLGAPLQLDLTGPPNGTVIVLAATALLPAPIDTGIGMVQVDGSSVFLTRATLLDASGEATFGVATVPTDPDLAGVDIHWQTLVGPPLAFANLETTTLSTF